MTTTVTRLLKLADVPRSRVALSVLLGGLTVLFGVGLMATAGYLISRAAERPAVLSLTAAGKLEIRRYAGTAVTVLGSVASGIPDLGAWNSFSFNVQGAFPVTLTGYVNGVPKLSATDSSASAYTGSGAAGK